MKGGFIRVFWLRALCENRVRSVKRSVKRRVGFAKRGYLCFGWLRTFGAELSFGKTLDGSAVFLDFVFKNAISRLWLKKDYVRGVKFEKGEAPGFFGVL